MCAVRAEFIIIRGLNVVTGIFFLFLFFFFNFKGYMAVLLADNQGIHARFN